MVQVKYPLLLGILVGVILVDPWKIPLYQVSTSLQNAPFLVSFSTLSLFPQNLTRSGNRRYFVSGL